MRLQRLDLIRYGHFTDWSIELPVGKADFHIIFGPNEAGKSTVLSAIEDLLFGIPMHSPYGFLHDYTTMRIGAGLNNGSSSLEVLRRKGIKDTLLGPDELSITGGEGALRPFLAGADRPFFERMFSLDHVRLKTGGQEILKAEDDVGQMLFSVGAGISGLRERLAQLSEEADGLWAARKARHRKYYQAEDKLKDANKELRERTFAAAKWQELKRTYVAAKETYVKTDKASKAVSADRNRLSRIRRIYRDIRRKQEMDRGMQALRDVVSLSRDARDVLEASEREVAEASTRIETLSGQLTQARTELEGLTYDETVVRRADDIHQLHERRIEIRGEKADLPKRQAELHAAEEEIRKLAAELGWKDDDSADLIARIPERTKVSVVRSLLTQRGELVADVANKTQALKEAEQDLATLRERLGEMGDLTDVSRLAAVIKAVREQGDITGRIRVAEKEAKDAQGRVDRLLTSMHPAIPGQKEAVEMHVPARASVQSHRDLVQDWKRRSHEMQQQVALTEKQLSRTRQALERTMREEKGVAAAELVAVRGRRDALWRLINLKHIQNTPIPKKDAAGYADDLDDLAGAFEPTMLEADTLADRRFDNAEAAAKLAEMARTIGEQEEKLTELQQWKIALKEESEQLKADWQAMWDKAPFEPLHPDEMIEWLDARYNFLEAIEEHKDAISKLEVQREEECDARDHLLTELAALAIDRGLAEKDGLAMILEQANDEQRAREAETQSQAKLNKDIQEAEAQMERHKRARTRAEKSWSVWQAKWFAALNDLGLAADLTPEAVGVQIEIVDQMRDKAGRINTLRLDRIDKIIRDIADFERVVTQIIAEVAEDLKDPPADAAVLELEARLAEAERVRELHASKKNTVENLEKQVEGLKEAQREATASVRHLMEAAGVETNEALKATIERSDSLRDLKTELATTCEKLEQDGDGLAVEVLESECVDVDIDEITAHEASINTELTELQGQLTAAAEDRSMAREAFQAVGGDDAAAQAAAVRQEALAEIREVAERYVRVRVSALLLQWAIDRYRREKRGPLLKRAGELFATLTGSSFTDLRVDYDDQDRAQLTGLRADGKIVPVSGMSTGSADQLYLALRVASIEDYLERADALPFVADNLFINFDDDRAAAGFKVLGQLAEKTQVLFFTHHQHLVDIAHEALGASIHMVSLRGERAGLG